MISTRDVKRKIRTVHNIEQITRAMKTVASIKLRRAEVRVRAARPYADRLAGLLAALGAVEIEHPLLQARPVNTNGIIIIGADRGLCGGYNANLIRRAQQAAHAAPRAQLITLGRKPSDFFRRAGYDLRQRLSPLGDEADFGPLAEVADLAAQLYADGEWDAVDVVYTRCVRGQQTPPVVERLLPLAPAEGVGALRLVGARDSRDVSEVAPAREFIYEPSPRRLLDELLPRYLGTRVWAAALDAKASEHQARVTAMTLATDNAQEMIDALTLQYNKARQAAITGELLDIVGTAEALA
ncbi:MAG TPA: ATP synthase F1 subunit gamma [Armatimonadota bacterium]|nr:ATP synthase F1 subunit gamma [Armatimonadota bacterium]